MPYRHLLFAAQDMPMNIVLIEDSELQREVVRAYMREILPHKSKFTSAETAGEGLAILAREPNTHCLLLDLHLPDRDGLSVMEEVRVHYPHLPVIILTGDTDRATALRCLKAGAQDYLVKGEYTLDSLERAVRYAIERHATLDALQKERDLSSMQKQFISLVSHEFRTPLSIISSAVQIMELKLDDDAKQIIAPQTKKITRAIDRLAGLMDNVLMLNRMEDGQMAFHPHTIDLAALVKLMAATMQEWVGEGRIQIEGEWPDQFYGDGKLIDYILSNLVANALKYSPAESSVVIRGMPQSTQFVMHIEDKGYGIPAEELAKIGTRFFRSETTRHIAGTGLGLFLARRFVELHGGHLYICSTEGEGTTVQLTFPVRAKKTRQTA
jgi:signal transduction histidine kinase